LNNPIRYSDPRGLDTTSGFGAGKISTPSNPAELKEATIRRPLPNPDASATGISSGQYNIMQAAYRNFGRNDAARRQADLAHDLGLAWLGLLASPFVPIVAVETAPVWTPLAFEIWANKNLISGASDFTAEMSANEWDIKRWNIASTAGATFFGNPFAASLPGGVFNISINTISGKGQIYQPITSLQTWKSIGWNTLGNIAGDRAEGFFLHRVGGKIVERTFSKFVGQQAGDQPSTMLDNADK
jgi:hypothetical protein